MGSKSVPKQWMRGNNGRMYVIDGDKAGWAEVQIMLKMSRELRRISGGPSIHHTPYGIYLLVTELPQTFNTALEAG